eukprot:Gb_23625 [translate_table: standard]
MDEATMQAEGNAVLDTNNNQPFEALVTELMSAGNKQRGHAEALFNLCKQHRPDTLVLKLLYTLQSCGQVEIRAMSAILLRKQVAKDESSLWPRLSPQTHATIKAQLLICVQREETKTIVKKLCDTVAELAAGLIEEGQWPELLPFMFQCVSSDSARLKESALLMFAQLSQCMGEYLRSHLFTLHTVFQQCLSPSAPMGVRVAALRATTNFIQTMETAQQRELFQDLLPGMMQALTEALNRREEATAQEALEMFIELAGTEPRFLRLQIVDVVGSMLQIAEADSLEEGTRHLAVEFIITLAEARERAPGMMRKLPQFIGRLFATLMKMLLDIEDDPAWHVANSDDEDAGETSNYEVGQECLDRLAISLGGNTIIPVASELMPSYVRDPDWRKRHAAMVTLAQIAEGCAKIASVCWSRLNGVQLHLQVMIKNLEQVVRMVLNLFQDPNARVRWAAINAIGQLSTDLSPDLQENYHQLVLPALAGAMDDFQNPRVQTLKPLVDVLNNGEPGPVIALESSKVIRIFSSLFQSL